MRELSNEIDPNSNTYLLAKIGFHTAENKHCKVCQLSVYSERTAQHPEQLRRKQHPAHRRPPLAPDEGEGLRNEAHVRRDHLAALLAPTALRPDATSFFLFSRQFLKERSKNTSRIFNFLKEGIPLSARAALATF